jgi:hypothetical protein
MLKTLIFSILGLALSSIQLFSQSFSNSPYSRFGIGDISGITYSPGIAMGGTGIALRSNHFINPVNPASYTSFDSLSFIFDIGGTNRTDIFKTQNTTLKNNRTEMTYFSIGFPVTHWWSTSLGLIPYSNVGYSIKDTLSIDTLYLENTYKGTGGISQFYIGNAFNLFTKIDTVIKKNNNVETFINKKFLAFGINSSYYFGSLDRNTTSIFPKENYLFDMYNTNRTIINDLGFKFGLQYIFNHNQIKGSEKTNKYTLIAGLTFDNKTNYNAKNTSLITKYLNVGGSVTIDTIENKVNQKGNITLPMNIGLGLTFISKESLTLTFDYNWQQWSSARFFGVNNNLKNSQMFAFGLQIIPDPHRINKYLNMVNYRLGGHFTQSYLNVSNQNMNDIGFSIGLGLPIRKPEKSEYSGLRRKLPTVINIALEMGQRGTSNDNLIKENYIQVSLNMSLYDIWFVKRRFN